MPGSLKAWCETLRRFGTMSLADVMQPAIRHAARGYRGDALSARMHQRQRGRDAEGQADLGDLSARRRAAEGRASAWCRPNMRETLTLIAQHGEAALYGGPLGDMLVDYMKAQAASSRTRISRPTRPSSAQPIRADYRGWTILGPPPPAASGVHIAQMLNILEGYDIAALGFGTAETIHLARRSPEDRLRRSRGRQRRSRLRQCAGGAADVEGLCRRAPPRRSIRRGAGLGRGRRAARKRAHHAHDGGGCFRQRGRDHADHQQSVRRQDPDPGPRHHRRTTT